jgi:uncharacterized membrane-anchored protein YitT (DUF2179 family)
MVVGADELKDVTDFIKSYDAKSFINITKSIGVKGNFYKEPIE